MTGTFWHGRRVLVTGHTGFKGSWLSLWLSSLGADVAGFSDTEEYPGGLYQRAGLSDLVKGYIGDVRNYEDVLEAMLQHRPQVVFHLAAQSLVRPSYARPAETYAINVLGTMHVLDAIREVGDVRAVVNVTSDKCYENQEWVWGYRESDRLGGHDPYSSSKGCAEIATASYRRSFFPAHTYNGHQVGLASARAGNVIGGGDWADERLVPDLFRAWSQGAMVNIRSPDATRPWQHVLEPLSGYMRLAELLYADGPRYAEAWNFGPSVESVCSVRHLVNQFQAAWPGGQAAFAQSTPNLHEAQQLALDCSKAHSRMGWRPVWALKDAVEATVAWCRHAQGDVEMRALSLAQIARYSESMYLRVGTQPQPSVQNDNAS